MSVNDSATDQEYADYIKSVIVELREVVRGAKKAGLDVKLEADATGCTSGARVSRNFYPGKDNIDEGKSK